MPVRSVNFIQEIPPSFRGKRNGSLIMHTEEWHDLCLMLGAGLKPQEFLSVTFPAGHEIYRDLRQPLQTLLGCAKTKIKQLQLPYDAYIRDSVMYVVGRGGVT